jgi:hypothetical protein
MNGSSYNDSGSSGGTSNYNDSGAYGGTSNYNDSGAYGVTDWASPSTPPITPTPYHYNYTSVESDFLDMYQNYK